MAKLGLFKNQDRVVEFNDHKIDPQILKNAYKEVSRDLKYGDIIWPTHVPKNEQCKDLVDKIEKRLVQNNNEYSRFSSDYFHCELSYEIFNENLKKGDRLDSDKNWKAIEIFKIENDTSSSNYFSALFYNKYKGQAILSHRGIGANVTDFFKKESTLSDDLHGILLHEYIGQLVKCYEVTEICYKIAKELRCTLSFTGFSNGAWLAENCLYFCEKYIKNDYVFDFEDFFEVQTKAVLFESPGIYRTKNEYETNIISNEYEFDIKSLNIVNYLLSPNLMNSINYHVGVVYRLFLDEKDQIELKQREFLDKFSNIPLIGKKITEYSVEIRFLFNGLNSMFNKIVLKKILDNCFDSDTQMAKNYCQMINWPLVKVDFDKNLKDNLKNLLDKSFEHLAEMIPFLHNFNTFLKPIQFVTKNIAGKLIQSLMEGFTPAIHILICIMIEYFKGNMDLKFCNNPLFYSRLEDINNIVINKEYIRKKYDNNKSKTIRENKSIDNLNENIVEKKIEKKFSLYYNSNYVPVRKSKIESKLLNISDDYTRNLDWVLFHLKRGTHFKNVQSKIVRNHLETLRQMYEIDRLDLKEKVIYLIRIKKDDVNFDKIKEIILRILSISREDIREIIFRNNVIDELNFTPNLGLRKPYVKRNTIIEQLKELFYDKNLIYLYGKPGTGKSYLAKEFGFRYLEFGLVRFFECEDNFQFSNSYHKFLLNFLDEYTTNFGCVDFEKLTEIACVKLLKQHSKILLIFDNVEIFDVIESVVSNFLLNDKIKILITTRNKELKKNFFSIEVKFFNQKEAFDYVKLNDQDNLLNQKMVESIVSKLGIKNDKNQIEILPKTLEVNIKYLTENYITDDLKSLLTKDDFQIFEYVFKTLDNDQIEMLRYFSFLNPKRINVLIIKDICKRDSKITDCIMKLNNIGIIDVHKKEKCLSMHRLIKNEIKKIFDTVKEKRKYLVELVNFVLKNLHENIAVNSEDLNDEFLEHMYEIVNDNISDTYEILKTINNYLKKMLPNEKFVELVLKISLQIHNILKSKKDNSLVLFSTSNLGICYFYLNKISESINLLNQVVINEQENCNHIRSLYYLAKCNLIQNKEKRALDFFQKAYSMHKQLLDKNKKEENKAIFFDYLNNIAICFLNLNKLVESKEIYLEIEKKYNNDFDEIYKCFNNLAFIYLKLDNIDNALKYYKKSFKILNEKCIKKDESELAKIANNIGFCLTKKDDFKNALTYYETAYDFQNNAVKYDIDPSTDIQIASYLNNIGVCHLKLNDLPNAIDFCEKGYKMRRSVMEKDHYELVLGLKNLALCFYKNNDKINAEKYYIQGEKMSVRLKIAKK